MSVRDQIEQMLKYRREAREEQRRDDAEDAKRASARVNALRQSGGGAVSPVVKARTSALAAGETPINARLAALQEIAARSQRLVEERRRTGQSKGVPSCKRNRFTKQAWDNEEECDEDSAVDSGVSPSLPPAGGAMTMRAASGMPLNPKPLSESALIVIDAQNTYTSGPMKLFKVEQALGNIKGLLDRAREASIPIYHVAHNGGKDTPFDIAAHSGAFCPIVKPQDDEGVIVKTHPSSFHETDLHKSLQALDIKNLILVGFMTHCCVNSTTRAAFNLGYESITVVADCTATRVLPDPTGKKETVTASMQQRAALAAVNDIFCNVVPDGSFIED